MTDIVERLMAMSNGYANEEADLLVEAASEIDRLKNGLAVEVERIRKAYLTSQVASLKEALSEVMTWIDNWCPEFMQDDEWPATKQKASAALQELSLVAKERGQ